MPRMVSLVILLKGGENSHGQLNQDGFTCIQVSSPIAFNTHLSANSFAAAEHSLSTDDRAVLETARATALADGCDGHFDHVLFW